MLTVSEKLAGGFIAVGGNVVFIERQGNRVRLSIDAPDDLRILRSDTIKKVLESNGFEMKSTNEWMKSGKKHTLKEALSGIKMDPRDMQGAA